MSDLALNDWQLAALDLDVLIEGPTSIALGDRTLNVPLIVRHFGAANGMIVVSSYAEISEYTEDLLQRGYGYSVMSPPRSDTEYNRESFIHLLSDWGWSGRPMDAPDWLLAYEEEE